MFFFSNFLSLHRLLKEFSRAKGKSDTTLLLMDEFVGMII